jgi:hypothetical protein
MKALAGAMLQEMPFNAHLVYLSKRVGPLQKACMEENRRIQTRNPMHHAHRE